MNKKFTQVKKEIVNFLDGITCHEYSYPEQREFNHNNPFTPEEIKTHINSSEKAQKKIQELKLLASTDLEKDEVLKLNSNCYHELQNIAVLRKQKILFTDSDLTNSDFFIYQNNRDPEIYLYLNQDNRSNLKTIENVLIELNALGNFNNSGLNENLQDKIMALIPNDIKTNLEFNVSLYKYDNLAHFSNLKGFTTPTDLSRGMITAISHNTKKGAHALIEQAPIELQDEIERTFVSFYPFLSDKMRSNEKTILQAISINPNNILEIPDIELSYELKKKVLSVALKEILPTIKKETNESIFIFSIANKIEKLSRFLDDKETNKKIKNEIEDPSEFTAMSCLNYFNDGLNKENSTELFTSPKIRM